MCFFTPVANQILSFFCCHLLADNQPYRLATATLSEVSALDPPGLPCLPPATQGQTDNLLRRTLDSFLPWTSFFPKDGLALYPGISQSRTAVRGGNNPGPDHSGSGGRVKLAKAKPVHQTLLSHSDSSELIVSIADSPTLTQDNSPSRIILPWRPPVHCFLRAQDISFSSFPGFFIRTSQDLGHHRTSEDYFTTGCFATRIRPEDLLSLLPDRVLLFLACVPIQSHQVSGGRRDRSPVVIHIYGHDNLDCHHRPLTRHFSSSAWTSCLHLDNREPIACLPAMDFALTTTTRWVFLFVPGLPQTESHAQAERETTEHLMVPQTTDDFRSTSTFFFNSLDTGPGMV